MQHIQKRLFSDFPKSPVQTQKRARNYSAITFKLQSNKQARYFSTTQLFKARTVKTDWVLGEITPPEPGAFPSFPEVAHGWAAAGWRSGGGTFPPRQYRLVLAHAFPPTHPFVSASKQTHTRVGGGGRCAACMVMVQSNPVLFADMSGSVGEVVLRAGGWAWAVFRFRT